MWFMKSWIHLMIAFPLLANAASGQANEELSQVIKNITPEFRYMYNFRSLKDGDAAIGQSNESTRQLVIALLLQKQSIKPILRKKSIDVNAPAIVDSCKWKLGWYTKEYQDLFCEFADNWGRINSPDAQALVNGLRPMGELRLTPLQATCITGDLEGMKLLIKAGANIDGGPKEMSPVTTCLATKRPEQVDFLLDQGAEVREKDPPFSLLSLLSHAYKNDSDQVEVERLAEKMITKGADPHRLYPAKHGDVSEIAVATMAGNLVVVKVLVKHGVDFNQKSSEGLTPLALAKKNDRLAVAEFLESIGAQE